MVLLYIILWYSSIYNSVSVMYRSYVSVMYRSCIGHVLTVLTCIVYVSSARQIRHCGGCVPELPRRPLPTAHHPSHAQLPSSPPEPHGACPGLLRAREPCPPILSSSRRSRWRSRAGSGAAARRTGLGAAAPRPYMWAMFTSDVYLPYMYIYGQYICCIR